MSMGTFTDPAYYMDARQREVQEPPASPASGAGRAGWPTTRALLQGAPVEPTRAFPKCTLAMPRIGSRGPAPGVSIPPHPKSVDRRATRLPLWLVRITSHRPVWHRLVRHVERDRVAIPDLC